MRVTRRDQILETAVELFRERGFAAVGVAELGERSGITGPGLYRHFQSKDEILATLFDRAMDRLLLYLAEATDDPWQALDALVDAQVRFVLDDQAKLAIYVREDRSLAEPFRRRIHARQREHVQRWVDTLAACHPDREEHELVTATHATLGLLLSVAHWPTQALRAPDLPAQLRALAMGTLSTLGRRPAKSRVSTSAAARANARPRS